MSGAGAASAMMSAASSAAISATSMLSPCGKGRAWVNAHFTAGMRRSNDISLESTGVVREVLDVRQSLIRQQSKTARPSHLCQCRWDPVQNIHADPSRGKR